MIRILATADIHSPEYLHLFLQSLNRVLSTPDIIVLAGDLVKKNNVYAFRPVYDALTKKFPGTPIIAVFGNEEYRGFEEKYLELYQEIRWLNDEYIILTLKNMRVGIIGTRGALDRPTPWQSKNILGIHRYYLELPRRIDRMAKKLRSEGIEHLILLTHYGVTYKNLRGEPEKVWPYLASSRIEKVLLENRFDIVIHGHAHNAVIDRIEIDSVEIYNVSLPARKKIVEIIYEPSTQKHLKGLDKWLYHK